MIVLDYALLGAAAYVFILFILIIFQRLFVFQRHPVFHRFVSAPNDHRDLHFKLATTDGEELDAVWAENSAAPQGTILYLHGNAADLRVKAPRIRQLRELGFSVLAIDWRGYGESSGAPTQEGLQFDAEAALAWLGRRADPSRVVVLAESIATGVAVELAAKHKVGALVLEAPYVSVLALARSYLPIFPVRTFLLDHFRSDFWIRRIDTNLLIQHGRRDRVIPFRHGERLYAMAPEPKRMIAYPRGGHDDLAEKHDSYRDLKAFVVECLRPSHQ